MSKQELKDLGKSKAGFQDRRKGAHQRFKFAKGGNEDILGLGTREDFVNEILYGMPNARHMLRLAKRGERRPGLSNNHHHGDLMNQEGEVNGGLAEHSVAGRGIGLPGDENIKSPERRLQAIRKGRLPHGPHGRGRLPYEPDMNGQRRHRAPEKKEAPEKVKARYGKWVKALEDKPDLSRRLHQLGATSLRTFGYEPPARFLDPPNDTYIRQCRVILEENLCDG
jgi:hypothetical protein